MALASWVRVGEDALTMLIAAGLSVYGTHVINALRCEAYEARQLNQYRLGRRLGTGGMGEVFLAEHRLLKRPCAVKLIRPEAAGDPAVLGRFNARSGSPHYRIPTRSRSTTTDEPTPARFFM